MTTCQTCAGARMETRYTCEDCEPSLMSNKTGESSHMSNTFPLGDLT